MATIRYSIGPSERIDAVVAATGLATVTKPIEVTIDFAGMIASGLSAPQARLLAISALGRIEEYIEQTGKLTAPG
jgi:hypothetical protein